MEVYPLVLPHKVKRSIEGLHVLCIRWWNRKVIRGMLQWLGDNYDIIWVEETRKIESGIDGFSRGCLIDGIALSGSILDFILLNKTAFEHSVPLFPWVQTLIGVSNIEPLTPEGCFKEVSRLKGGNNNGDGIWMPYHSKDTFLWAPAPSVVDLVLRELGQAVHKRPNSLHVLICHKLMM